MRVASDHVHISLSDNGIGISSKDQKIIFDKFRQVKSTAGGRPKGTGLGLAITRSIIAFHGGRIWVESSVGEGSTFHFTLPLAGHPTLPRQKATPSAA
jgi:signal transduction histidine kinase